MTFDLQIHIDSQSPKRENNHRDTLTIQGCFLEGKQGSKILRETTSGLRYVIQVVSPMSLWYTENDVDACHVAGRTGRGVAE